MKTFREYINEAAKAKKGDYIFVEPNGGITVIKAKDLQDHQDNELGFGDDEFSKLKKLKGADLFTSRFGDKQAVICVI
jgi:hypothetical protein